MKEKVFGFAIAAVVLIAVSLVLFPRHDSADVAHAVGEVQAAQATVRKALDSAKTVERANAILKAQADSARQRERYAELRLESAKTAFQKAAQAAPPECDSVIAAAKTQQAASDVTLAAEKEGHAKDTQRADNAEQALHALIAPVATLDTASTKLVKASKPGLLSRLKPRIFVGVVGGVGPTGKPSATAGIGFGWSF